MTPLAAWTASAATTPSMGLEERTPLPRTRVTRSCNSQVSFPFPSSTELDQRGGLTHGPLQRPKTAVRRTAGGAQALPTAPAGALGEHCGADPGCGRDAQRRPSHGLTALAFSDL